MSTRQVPVGKTYPSCVSMYSVIKTILKLSSIFSSIIIVTCKTLHSLRCSSHADKLDITKHLFKIMRPRSKSEMIENILLHLLDVRIHQLHLLTSLTPSTIIQKYFILSSIQITFSLSHFSLGSGSIHLRQMFSYYS